MISWVVGRWYIVFAVGGGACSIVSDCIRFVVVAVGGGTWSVVSDFICFAVGGGGGGDA